MGLSEPARAGLPARPGRAGGGSDDSETGDRQREFDFTAADMGHLIALVRERTGIVLTEKKSDMVYARLAKRLRQLGMRTFKDYRALLAESGDGAEELALFINAITTNLTRFFREEHHFQHLRQDVLRPLAAAPLPASGRRRLRIWSAGCSTGQEPFSIAMSVMEELRSLTGWDARILATDLDTAVLAVGKSGLYKQNDAAGMPPALRQRYVKAATDIQGRFGEPMVRMAAGLQTMITFKPLNLLGPWPMTGPFDAIFCRNVMIYFDRETQAMLADRFAGMLKPDGWLYLGHSESLLKNSDCFVLRGRTIFQRRA